jgi:hypothetical protein
MKTTTKTKVSDKISKSELSKIKSIRRRTGEVAPFDLERVARAIFKAFEVTNEGGEKRQCFFILISVLQFSNHPENEWLL